MQGLIQWACRRWRRTVLAMPLLLVGLFVAGCGTSLFGNTPSSEEANASDSSVTEQNATLSLQPASGYGGLYVQVSGAHWPGNMMVLVTLEDEQGRSVTLAGSDTDATGNLTTGFIYPIDQRWLASPSPWVVLTTADGKIEAKAKFTTVPPGTEVAATSPLATETVPDVAAAASVTTTEAVTTEEGNHVLALPLVASAETARSSTSGAKQVSVDISSGPINCRDGNEWFTVTILSGGDFDALSVDPGSVDVYGEPNSEASQLISPMPTSIELVKSDKSEKNREKNREKKREKEREKEREQERPVEAQNNANSAYQWRWHLEDANQDGSTDMVMEFQVGITDLTCDAGVVVVTGRTNDGGRFEGSDPVTMVGLDQG
jgi:hypothetical protein